MRLFILTTVLYFGIINLYAQHTETKKQFFPINIGIMHETTSVPFFSSPIKFKYNPALFIGSEYLLKKTNNYDFHLSGNLGYYYHKDWESTLFTEIRFGYRKLLNRFSINAELGVGYAHIFALKPIYKFTNKQFDEVNNNGLAAFQSSLSISPSFKLSQKENSAEIYIAYTFAAQYPYSDTKGFHQFIGLGYKFYPFKNK